MKKKAIDLTMEEIDKICNKYENIYACRWECPLRKWCKNDNIDIEVEIEEENK